MWINTTDATNRNHAALYFGNSAANDQYYAVGTPGSGMPQLVARNTTAINTPGPTTASDGVWHHLAAVFAATNDRTLYFDGRLAATSVTSVTHPSVIRFGVGGLTRATQTDAFSGLIDEVGLFDTVQTAAQVALFNAFPRYDNVPLSDSDYASAISIFNTQIGSVTTGNWTWRYATGLAGSLGTTGVSGGNPFVVLDNAGNGLVAVPEPTISVLGAFGLAFFGASRLRERTRPGSVDQGQCDEGDSSTARSMRRSGMSHISATTT